MKGAQNIRNRKEILTKLEGFINRLGYLDKGIKANGFYLSTIYASEKGNHIFKGASNANYSKTLKKLKSYKRDIGSSNDVEVGLYDDAIDFIEEKCEIVVKKLELAYGPYSSKQGHLTAPKTKSDFIGKSWYLYFYYIKAGSERDEPALGRAVLSIRDDLPKGKNVECLNISEDGRSQDYLGSYDFTSSNRDGDKQVMMLYFDLKPKESQDDNTKYARLHIKATCLNYDDLIVLGAYVTYEHNNVTMGTVVMELRKDEGLTAAAMSTKRNPDLFQSTKLAIRRYLSLKDLNYTKISNRIHTLEDLESMVNSRELKRKLMFFDEDKPILFIARTNTSLHPENRPNFNTSIKNLAETLKKRFKDKLSVNYDEGTTNKALFKDKFKSKLESLKRTSYFVLIMTETTRNSFALIEMGLALAYCKSILVFYKKGSISNIVEFLDGMGEGDNRVILQEISDSHIEIMKDMDIEFLQNDKYNSEEFIIYDIIQTVVSKAFP